MPRGGVELQLYSFFNLGARCGGWLAPRPGRFTPGKKTRHPLYRRLGGLQGRSVRLRKIFLHRDSIPRPSISQRIAIPATLSRPTYRRVVTSKKGSICWDLRDFVISVSFKDSSEPLIKSICSECMCLRVSRYNLHTRLACSPKSCSCFLGFTPSILWAQECVRHLT